MSLYLAKSYSCINLQLQPQSCMLTTPGSACTHRAGVIMCNLFLYFTPAVPSNGLYRADRGTGCHDTRMISPPWLVPCVSLTAIRYWLQWMGESGQQQPSAPCHTVEIVWKWVCVRVCHSVNPAKAHTNTKNHFGWNRLGASPGRNDRPAVNNRPILITKGRWWRQWQWKVGKMWLHTTPLTTSPSPRETRLHWRAGHSPGHFDQPAHFALKVEITAEFQQVHNIQIESVFYMQYV